MRTFLLVLAVAGLALAAAPTAEAHHFSCQPDYPCSPVPCDVKCWATHFVDAVLCLVKSTC